MRNERTVSSLGPCYGSVDIMEIFAVMVRYRGSSIDKTARQKARYTYIRLTRVSNSIFMLSPCLGHRHKVTSPSVGVVHLQEYSFMAVYGEPQIRQALFLEPERYRLGVETKFL